VDIDQYDLPTAVAIAPARSAHDAFEDVAVQADGRIVVAGRGAFTSGWDMTVLRSEEDGDSDATFSGDGRRRSTSPPTTRANAVAIQPDGRIVLAADATPAGSSQSRCRGGCSSAARRAATRQNRRRVSGRGGLARRRGETIRRPREGSPCSTCSR
jgi:sugar lactone lactonase YvrE